LEGSEQWDAGNVEGANKVWEELQHAGNPSSDLRYNLGNTAYRKGDIPRAIAWWRSAALLAPRDSDIHHNLAFGRSQLKGVPEPAALGWRGVLTPGEVGFLGLIGAISAVAGVMISGRLRVPRWPWFLLAVGGLAVSWVAHVGWRDSQERPLAVVVEAAVGVRPDPMAEAQVEFELPAGSELQVRAEQGAFLLVETGDAQRGWIPRGSAMVLRP